MIARLLLLTFVSMSSLPSPLFGVASAEQWDDPNNATYGQDVTLENSQDGLQTEFTIDSSQTAIGWQDLQQPEDNTLTFTFTNPTDQSTVLNYIGAQHPSNLNGRVECDGCTVAFANPYGIYIGGKAILDVGNLALIAGEINQTDFLTSGLIEPQLEGDIWNDGSIHADGNALLLGRNVVNNGEIQVDDGVLLMLAGQEVSGLDLDSLTDDFLGDGSDLIAQLADGVVTNSGAIAAPDAALIGRHVANHGEIEIADGTLLMLSADAVWLARFDDPISIKIPRTDVETQTTPPDYAIENDGRIDAGLGHVRLSASDPLGFSIRQGSSGAIAARRIEIEGGDSGRVELAGSLDASNDAPEATGGEIDVTGSILSLTDAHIDASGTRGGGTIQIGGEQEGKGELQRAQAVIIDAPSTLRADALENGDGGRVIVFSEGITSVDGAISARGGENGGDGGFVETSGLARFAISRTPDVSARMGSAGDWLIDPYDICISLDPMGCGATAPIPNSLDAAIDAILDPDFDASIFDSIIRTEGPSLVDPNVIAKALAVGTNITLSTQVFGTPTGGPEQTGDITIEDAILIPNSAALASTTATLTLLAAGSINVDADIIAGTVGQDPNLSLNVVLVANDARQNDVTASFSYARIQGDVVINADIDTGGGALIARGVAIHQDAASSITTHGGGVNFTSGSLDAAGIPTTFVRTNNDPGIRAEDIQPGDPEPFLPASTTGYAPVAITIDGSIDTRNTSGNNEPGGDVRLLATSVNVSTGSRSDVVTSELTISSSATIVSGGGDINLQSGGDSVSTGVGFAGNVTVEGDLNACALASCATIDVGGDVAIAGFHIDPTGGISQSVDFVEADPAETPDRGEGGLVTIDVGPAGIQTGGGTVTIGSTATRNISIDGDLLATNPMNLDEQGLISIVGVDELAVDSVDDTFGEGQISIGTNGTTTLAAAGIWIEGRSVTTSNGGGGNVVTLNAIGESSASLDNVEVNQLQIVGRKEIDLGVDTTLTSETVLIDAATRPTELTSSERLSGDVALQFRGSNGPGGSGVRVNATTVDISTGDGTTSTTDLFQDDLVDESGIPTDFAVSRSPYGNYAGLQLESLATPGERPDEISIAQDASFTISDAAAVGDSDLNLERAFDGAVIGAQGMNISLESSDGVLTITDATALNNNAVTQPDSDAGKSWVTLLGGLLLPVFVPVASEPPPPPEAVPTANSVVFGDDGGVTPLASPFDVEALSVSTPGDMAVNQQVALSVGSVNELTFEAGRNTGVDDAAGRGTLTVGDSLAALVLSAGESLSILAGASGFGDLVFEATAAQPITLQANDISLRAGAGKSGLNTNTSDRSAIQGLASSDLDFRDAAGNAFGSNASTVPLAFRYQQDAAIDAASDLPSLDQFGLLPADGFRDARDVVYSVRSDFGIIDLDDGVVGTNEGDRFRDSALSLIGTDSGSGAPFQISDEFSFQGDSIEVGSTSQFRFSQVYANAFNRSNTNPNAEMTLRSGVGGIGNISFDVGVPVVAARINLFAGDGVGGSVGSAIDPRNATFDLSGAAAGAKTFVFQQDQTITNGTVLPTVDQFGGLSGAPNILALRSDSGSLSFDDLDFSALPIDTGNAISRLILEANSISLTRSNDADPDLDLESPNGLQLRLRANILALIANDGTLDENGGRVLAGTSNPTVMGDDADFDADTLLVEGFDLESEDATVENLSSLSADTEGVFEFDLADGGGPNSILISQNGSVIADDLPENGSISGLLASGNDEDEDGTVNATNYSITSRFGPVALNPAKVNGSHLAVIGDSGTAASTIDSAIDFAAGDYDLASLIARTEDSILILENTTFAATDFLSFSAGEILQPSGAVTEQMGSLIFQSIGGTRTIDLRANQINLAAGSIFTLFEFGGSGDEVDPMFLPRIELSGLNEIERTGDFQDSSFLISQNAALDLTIDTNSDGVPDLIEALENNPSDPITPDNPNGLDWKDIDFNSVQGELSLSGIDHLVDITENLLAETGSLGSIVTDLEDHAVDFTDFDGNVTYDSNDITFKTDSLSKQIDLAAPNLELRSFETDADELRPIPDEDTRFLLRDDPNALERAIVRIQQVADFDASSALPLPAQYTIQRTSFNFDGSVNSVITPRQSLATLDIELSVTGGQTLTLDDEIRERIYGSNLILKSAGDVAIDLIGGAAGFDLIDAAALQLSSLDIRTNYDPVLDTSGGRDIFFTIVGFPTAAQAGFDPPPVMIQTTGDQRLDGNLVLQETLTARGRNTTLTGNVSTTNPNAGLMFQTGGKLNFQGDEVGTLANPLAFLEVLFENVSSTVPNVEFGTRLDLDGDGIFETPTFSNQTVHVVGDITFQADNATSTTPGIRTSSAPFATIGKALGDLNFISTAGDFVMGTGEKLSVGGLANIDASNGDARLGDVSAIDLVVTADNIALARRATGTYFDSLGETQSDSGPTISANTILFQDQNGVPVSPTRVGYGKETVFGVPNPFSASTYPAFLRFFSLFEIRPDGSPLTVSDFQFSETGASPNLAAQVPTLPPIGSSRSDLSGAFGPKNVPHPGRDVPDPFEIVHPEQLVELGVDPLATSERVRIERLDGAAVIDDSALGSTKSGLVYVTESRIDASDAQAAIEIYEHLFGADGARTDEVRAVLQMALDRYLEETRVRRVVGFELRRFVKNRPSTLIDAYQTLESLDTLFRYHRRLGLSPGEYRQIQREWLSEIQPEGITLDELSETIHPSRYVRGSDILDIFGQ